MGRDPERIIVGGGSGGGGLAAGVALMARDKGEINLFAQCLIYPMLDDRNHRLFTPVHRGLRPHLAPGIQ